MKNCSFSFSQQNNDLDGVSRAILSAWRILWQNNSNKENGNVYLYYICLLLGLVLDHKCIIFRFYHYSDSFLLYLYTLCFIILLYDFPTYFFGLRASFVSIGAIFMVHTDRRLELSANIFLVEWRFSNILDWHRTFFIRKLLNKRKI